MNLFLLIFCIAGLCYGSESTSHYRYKYSGGFKSGIPDDGNQVSGFGMKATLDVFMQNKDGTAIFKLSDVLILIFNDDFGTSEEIDFTDERFHQFEDEDLAKTVERPFRVNLRGSDPFAIEFEDNEYRWLSNVRKGIASLFINEILKGNFEAQEEKDSISSLFHEGHLLNTFNVEEETLFGICQAKYKIHQIPDTMFRGQNDLIPSREKGTKENLWYVSRSIDFDKCTEIVAIHMHTTNDRNHKDKKLRFTRSSDSSYVLRGSPGHFELYSVTTEGVTSFPVSLSDEHEAQSRVKQKLVLIDEDNTEFIPELGSNLKRSETWMHEIWSPSLTPKLNKHHPFVIYSNENDSVHEHDMFGNIKFDADEIAGVKVKILELIRTAAKKLTDLNQETKDPPNDVVSESLLLANYYFKTLKKDDILKIFDHFFEKENELEKQLVINAAAASGFRDSMEAIMDYIEKDKLRPAQVFTTFIMFSRNSIGSFNVSRIMDHLLSQREPSAYLLNFAHYLSEYCIHKVHNYLPYLGNAECDSSIITKRLISYLKDIIYNENLTWERGLAIKVLDLLRTAFTFEIVSPLIDGRMKSSVALKTMAVRALENWSLYPETTLDKPIKDLLTDVYSDISQDLHVRISALLALTSYAPSKKFWYNLALSTWKEPSIEFASFTSSLIKTYSEIDISALEKQSRGASFALKYSKPSSKSAHSNFIALSNSFFNRQAKVSMIFYDIAKGDSRDPHEIGFNILANIEGLNLFKIEQNVLYNERVTLFNETVPRKHSRSTPANEFLDKLYNEIHLVEHPNKDMERKEVFYQFLGDIFTTFSSVKENFYPLPDPDDSNKLSWVGYFNLMDKLDFHPNELGLPLFIYSTMPTALGISAKVPRQFLIKVSSVYSREISVFFPWNHRYSTVMVKSNLEITLPIGMKVEPNAQTEEPLHSTKKYFDFLYNKKFPLLRLSNTPMIIKSHVDLKTGDVVQNFEVIRKLKIREKNINEVNPHTGIKFNLVLKTDTDHPTSFSLRRFLQYPDLVFKFWSLDIYIHPEESETKEMSFTSYRELLFKPVEKEESDANLEESKELKSEVTFYDTNEERTRKLTNFLKNESDGMAYDTIKFDFIGGEVPRHFELFFASYEGQLDHEIGPYHYSFDLIGFSGLEQEFKHNSVCLTYFISSYLDPSRYYYDSNSAIQGRHLEEMELEVLADCTQKILTANVVYNTSERGLDETKEYCKENYGEEKCYVEKLDLLTIDDIWVKLQQKENDFVRNVIHFAKTFYNIPSDKDTSTEFNILRNIDQGDWDLYQKSGSESVFLSTISYNFAFVFNDLDRYFVPFRDIGYSQSPSKCTLTKNSVETFDGVNYDYDLSNCWTLVSQTPSDHYRKYVFLVRKPQGESSVPDFKYIYLSNKEETVIEFSNNEFKVNGSIVHKIKEEEHDVFNTIQDNLLYKRGNTYIIYLNDIHERPQVIINIDRIELYKEFNNIRSNGICGNGDGEAIPELIGPKQCVYDDAQLFTASWTGQSEDCDYATLDEFRKGVKDYQDKCEPYDGQLKDSQVNHRCLFYGWKVLTINENSYCISVQPLPFCSSTCDLKEAKTVKKTYKCWSKEKAPERLRTSIKNAVDIVTDNISADPEFYEYSSTEIATLCKQF